MGLLKQGVGAAPPKPVHLVLSKDRVRSVKRGHPWVFQEVLRELPPAPAGSLALLKDKEGDILAKGYYEPDCRIAFRTLALGKERLDDSLVSKRLSKALALRKRLFPDNSTTNGFRLVNGEGDGLPGLVIDVYGHVAVIKLDGPGASAFYDAKGLSEWLMSDVLPHTTSDNQPPCCYLKYRSGDEAGRGQVVAGQLPKGPVLLLENGARFLVDVVAGQKTGFFLDQRDNRALMRRLVPEGARVLNVFGYTGGFSIYAGLGGAGHVTTVDLAANAVKAACKNWELNGLDPSKHEGCAQDAFEFLETAVKAKQQWDVVVVDPPSFAPNKQSVDRAKASYQRIFTLAAQVTSPGGLNALASCSSHMPPALFNEVCEEAVAGAARRQAITLAMMGQPADHPFPLACEELRYLKFNLYQMQ